MGWAGVLAAVVAAALLGVPFWPLLVVAGAVAFGRFSAWKVEGH